MTPEEELTEKVIAGQDAEDFVHGRVGQKVIELARREVDAAALDMRDVDLKDEKKLREIQNRIWRATQFEAWLEEIIVEGKESYKQLKGEYEPSN
jgi:hypothetical protein